MQVHLQPFNLALDVICHTTSLQDGESSHANGAVSTTHVPASY